MNENIIIIDNQRYFIDSDNDCLVPLDDYDSESNFELKNKIDKNNYIDKFGSKFDDNYLDYSLKKFEEVNDINGTSTNTNKNTSSSTDNNKNSENLDNLNEWYMENYDIDFWENILSRTLDGDEKKIFHGV